MAFDHTPLSKVILFFFVWVGQVAFASPPDGNCYGSRALGGADQFKSQGIRFVREEEKGPEDLPSEWDWRNQAGGFWETPVRSQSSCGDCVMHAVTSVFESQLKIQSGFSWFDPRLSINEGFHCGGGSCSTGWDAELALNRGMRVGFLDDSCGVAVTSPEACGKAECREASERRWKIRQVHKITDGTLDVSAIRRALLRGPVLTGMALYPDFACYQWGVYRHEDSKPSRAGHMISIIGYSAAKRAWIVKNSWGPKWAYQGYGFIYEKDSSGIGIQSWQMEVEDQRPVVMITGVADNEALTGTRQIRANASPELTDFGLYLSTSGEGHEMQRCSSKNECQFNFSASTLAPGNYEISARRNLAEAPLGFPVFFRVEPRPVPSTPKSQIVSGAQSFRESMVIPVKEIRDGGQNLSSIRSLKAWLEDGWGLKTSSRPFLVLEARLRDAQGRIVAQVQTSDFSSGAKIHLAPWARRQAKDLTLNFKEKPTRGDHDRM